MSASTNFYKLKEVLTTNREFTREFPEDYKTHLSVAMIIVDKGVGTGCFIKFRLPNGELLYAFVTNEHVLAAEDLVPGKKYKLRQERPGKKDKKKKDQNGKLDQTEFLEFELEVGTAVSNSLNRAILTI